jgi:hypothetical protein
MVTCNNQQLKGPADVRARSKKAVCFVLSYVPALSARSLINFVPFSSDSLQRVFGTVMDWFLSEGFAPSVKALGSSIVSGTIGVYEMIAENLLPTPAKSHYTFNLRDMSKVRCTLAFAHYMMQV